MNLRKLKNYLKKTTHKSLKINVQVIDAFTYKNSGGNRAGVVIDSELNKSQKQGLATKLGFSETVYAHKVENEDYEYYLEYFTVEKEIDYCGHATIAFLSAINKDSVIIKTKNLLLEGIRKDNSFFIKICNLSIADIKIDKEIITNSLNTSISALVGDPIKMSTGVYDIFIEVKDIETLKKIQPNFERVKQASKLYNAVGYHLYAIDNSDFSTAYVRNLAPDFGIDEESATGSANSALACYLHKVKEIKVNNMKFYQGFNLGNESIIKVVFIKGNNQYVGGECKFCHQISCEF